MPVVTIKDIARETGLSPATVARALGEGGPARPETRKKVRDAAARLGYVANSAARSMRNQSSNMVGLIVPDIVNRFYSEMAQAIRLPVMRVGCTFYLRSPMTMQSENCARCGPWSPPVPLQWPWFRGRRRIPIWAR